MPSERYQNVVFDFGGVLITPITNVLDEMARRHGVSMLTLLDVLIGPREHSTRDHPWHRCERGEIATADLGPLVVPFAEAAGITLVGDEYDTLLGGTYTPRPHVVDRVRQLRAEGYRTGLLTNSFREFRPIIEGYIDITVFDVVVDSSEVGMRKPEPEIYALTEQMLGADPSSIVYLDDFHGNVVGADAAGWTTVHVTDIDVALAALDEILGR